MSNGEVGTTVELNSPFDDDDDDDNNDDNNESTKSQNGSKVSVSLATYPPDNDEDKDDTTQSSTNVASSNSTTISSVQMSYEQKCNKRWFRVTCVSRTFGTVAARRDSFSLGSIYKTQVRLIQFELLTVNLALRVKFSDISPIIRWKFSLNLCSHLWWDLSSNKINLKLNHEFKFKISLSPIFRWNLSSILRWKFNRNLRGASSVNGVFRSLISSVD